MNFHKWNSYRRASSSLQMSRLPFGVKVKIKQNIHRVKITELNSSTRSRFFSCFNEDKMRIMIGCDWHTQHRAHTNTKFPNYTLYRSGCVERIQRLRTSVTMRTRAKIVVVVAMLIKCSWMRKDEIEMDWMMQRFCSKIGNFFCHFQRKWDKTFECT